VRTADGDVEIGECGSHPEAPVEPAAGDRERIGDGAGDVTMLAKGIAAVRLLRSTDPRVAAS
jgi:hypothetical protein